MFIREKKIECGRYREVDIIPRTEEAEKAAKGKRTGRVKVTEPKQRDLNEKNSKRYIVQLGNGNFGKGDLHTTCTYSYKNLPDTEEEAERIVWNYLRRIARRRKRKGLEALKYIIVTEYVVETCEKEGQEVEKPVRIHHHIIMNGGLDRDEVEMMWTHKRINWRRHERDPDYRNTIEQIGWVNADRLQTNENGIEALCKYMVKNPRGKKRWSSSRNLIRPEQMQPNDTEYSVRKVENLAKSPDQGKEFFEKRFKNFRISEIRPEYHEETGWHIYLKMWRKEPKKRRTKRQKKKHKEAGRRDRS